MGTMIVGLDATLDHDQGEVIKNIVVLDVRSQVINHSGLNHLGRTIPGSLHSCH